MVTASFKNWLKGNTTMKLSSDAAVLRLLQEGLTKEGNWKKKFKKAMHTDAGLKSVMSLLADAEKNNSAFVSALQSSFSVPPTANISAVTPTVQFQLPPVPTATPSVTPGVNPGTTVASAIATAFPATSVKLNSILHNGKK